MMTVVDQVRPLADAEEDVRGQDPAPGRRPHQEERHRRRDEPPGDEDVLAPEAIREAAGELVRERLGHAEDDDERQDGGSGGEVELLLRDGRAGCSAPGRPSRPRRR